MHQRQTQLERTKEHEEAKLKMPSKKWPNPYMILMHICEVEVKIELPEVWLDLAKSNEKEEQLILQEHLQCRSQHANHYTEQFMVVTSSLACNLVNLEFLGSGLNNNAEGLQPFCMPCRDGNQRVTTIANARDFDLIK